MEEAVKGTKFVRMEWETLVKRKVLCLKERSEAKRDSELLLTTLPSIWMEILPH